MRGNCRHVRAASGKCFWSLLPLVLNQLDYANAVEETVEWQSGHYVLSRDGGPVGVLLDDTGFPSATGVLAPFTDFASRAYDSTVARAREQSTACWHGSWTPDLCCAGDGGWADCWDGVAFTFESCCAGWTSSKDSRLMKFAREAYAEAHVALFQPSDNPPSAFYIHALVFPSLVSQLHGRSNPTPLTIVEVGVDIGSFASTALKEFRRLGTRIGTYTLVDPWEPIEGSQLGQADAFRSAAEAAAVFWPVSKLIQATSSKAARLFDDESVDFVFVDAMHSYQAVRDDLDTWWPKVRPGGLLSGHDYSPEKPERFPGPIAAAQELAHRFGLSHELIGLPGRTFALLKA